MDRETKIQYRNVVFHGYSEQINARGLNATKELDQIVSTIVSDLKEAGHNVHANVIREFVVEAILEHSGVEAFGITPVFDEKKETRPVTEILNELVDKGVLPSHWRTV